MRPLGDLCLSHGSDPPRRGSLHARIHSNSRRARGDTALYPWRPSSFSSARVVNYLWAIPPTRARRNVSNHSSVRARRGSREGGSCVGRSGRTRPSRSYSHRRCPDPLPPATPHVRRPRPPALSDPPPLSRRRAARSRERRLAVGGRPALRPHRPPHRHAQGQSHCGGASVAMRARVLCVRGVGAARHADFIARARRV